MRELCVVQDHADPEDRDEDTPTTAALPFPPAPVPLGAQVSIPALVAERAKSKQFFWSVELIPGTTPQLQSLLEQSLQQLARNPPAFVSVSWHVRHLELVGPGGAATLQHPALELSKLLQDTYGIPALMHLAAGKMKRAETQVVLQACLAAGVTNILALRGDGEIDAESDFQHASQLVKFIRAIFGTKFNIGVAGYPSGHPETTSLAENLLHLKEKIDAGADFVLTQMITSIEEFHTFTQHCKKLGMRVPILPGLFLIQSQYAFEKFIRMCRIKVPLKILQDLKEFNNKTLETKYGEHHFQNLLNNLMNYSCCPGVHIFSMNRVAPVLKLFSEIGLVQQDLQQVIKELEGKQISSTDTKVQEIF